MHAWILPEFIADLLPVEAANLERLRRDLLDHFKLHGYRLVQPPLLEYVESLQLQGNADLEIQTFRLVDQLSGRQLGLRADMTPQAARIDAHLINSSAVTRLCYAGPVAHSRPRDLLTTREPYQIGAELYGHAGLDADLEIIGLLLDTLHAAGVSNIHLDLGHVAIQQTLLQAAAVSTDTSNAIIAALHNKDSSTLADLTAALPTAIAGPLRALPNLYGGVETLTAARGVLGSLPGIGEALDAIQRVAEHVGARCHVRIDLAEQRVGAYHSGLVFAAYADGLPTALARGGRYDDVGRRFGRARPAVGFSLDARELLRVIPARDEQQGILAPLQADAALQQTIGTLRRAGETVIVDLAGAGDAKAHDCNRHLVLHNGQWQIELL